MIKLRGTTTVVKEAEVELSPEDFYKEVMKQYTPVELAIIARRSWLKSKGLGTDVKLKNNHNGYYWEEYEDHGSHYSGYYEVKGAYEEGDEHTWENFIKLIGSL